MSLPPSQWPVMVLTDGIRRALQDGAASLKGYARRLFMARTVRDFGPGGQRFAERELGWNRRTVCMGAHELRRGVQCVAAAQDIQVQLAYYPPYHSKYNPVERVWGALENAWNGDLLDTCR